MLHDDRNPVRETIALLGIPKGTVSSLAGLSNSEISEYLHGHTVSDANCIKIQNAVSEIADLIGFMKEHLGLRPDLRDVWSLREAIEIVTAARRCAQLSALDHQLEELVEQTAKQLSAL